MKSPNKRPWPLSSIFVNRDKINTNPDFQRPPVWKTAQKQLLIDTVLRNYDIPKVYLREVSSSPEKYDVIDGQQRLRAVWGFFGKDEKYPGYPLSVKHESIDGIAVAGKKYGELSQELRDRFDTYSLDVVIIQDAEEDEVRDMFVRLQSGTPLNAQEQRNAFKGNMRDFAIKTAQHDFFKAVMFTNHRYAHHHAAAQLVCVELAGSKPTNIRKADLDRMYLLNENFDESGQIAKRVKRMLSNLREIFPDDNPTPELERFNIVPLYCMVSQLLDGYVFDEVKNQFRDWFVGFEQRRVAESEKDPDDAGPEWLNYRENIGHSGDNGEVIQNRLDFLLRNFFEKFPDLPAKDERNFTEAQRLTIYWRDGKKCQIKQQCDGTELLPWNGWHCDHKLPRSRGGKTTVGNGQVACPACNLAKGNRVA